MTTQLNCPELGSSEWLGLEAACPPPRALPGALFSGGPLPMSLLSGSLWSFFVYFCLFLSLRATPVAYGSSQARR